MTCNKVEQERILMDLNVAQGSNKCCYTVAFYGAIYREVSFQTHVQ